MKNGAPLARGAGLDMNNLTKIQGDALVSLQSRLHRALAEFQQAPTKDYVLAVLTSELAAYHEAVRAGVIATSPLSKSVLKRRIALALLDAFDDVLRGDPPDACLDLARQLRDLNKELSQ